MATRKAGTAVAEPVRSSREIALRNAPPLEIDREDIKFGAIKVGQHMTSQVQDGLVGYGDIYSSTGKDDADPHVLLKAEDPAGLLIHVLGMRKGKSYSEQGGELQTWRFGNPEAHPDAWTTYQYIVVCPEVSESEPFKLLLTKTGAPAAKQINFVLKKSGLPAWESAFRLTTAKRENPKGKYCIFQVRNAVANTPAAAKDHAANVEIAEALVALAADGPSGVQAAPAGDTPDI